MKPFVILNDAAGTMVAQSDGGGGADADPAEVIARAFADRGVTAVVRKVKGPEIVTVAAEAAAGDCDTVIAGGGDGTLNAVASAVVGTGKAFAVLPLGTLNHLAKEVGMPSDLAEAVAAILDGPVAPLPIGKVNDKYFLSFSALGLYTQIIKHRDAQRKTLGRKKWPAMAVSIVKHVVKFKLWRLDLDADGKTFRRRTPVLFVTLSEHQKQMLGLRPDDAAPGRSALSVYITRATRRTSLIALFARAMVGRLSTAKNFEEHEAHRLDVGSREQSMRVALDGEIVDLRPPLRYQLLPDALLMIRPRNPAPAGTIKRPSV